jgi:hypothetical protein
MTCRYEVVVWNPGRGARALHKPATSLFAAQALGRSLTQEMYSKAKISRYCDGKAPESFPCSYWSRCSPKASPLGELEGLGTLSAMAVAAVLGGAAMYWYTHRS